MPKKTLPPFMKKGDKNVPAEGAKPNPFAKKVKKGK